MRRMFPDPVIIEADGRDIAVEDSGPGSGFPIIMMNGAGSRHLFGPAVREGRDLGFRLARTEGKRRRSGFQQHGVAGRKGRHRRPQQACGGAKSCAKSCTKSGEHRAPAGEDIRLEIWPGHEADADHFWQPMSSRGQSAG